VRGVAAECAEVDEDGDDEITRYSPLSEPFELIAKAYASVVSGMKMKPNSGQRIVWYAAPR